MPGLIMRPGFVVVVRFMSMRYNEGIIWYDGKEMQCS